MTGLALVAALLAAGAVAALAGLPRPGGARLSAMGRAVTDPAPLRAARRPRPRVVAAAGALVGGLAFGPAAAAAAGLLGHAAAGSAARRSRSRTAADERFRAVEACLALAAELRAGRTPAEALTEAAPLAAGGVRDALTAAAAAAAVGGDVAVVLGAPRRTAEARLLRALGACWQVCASTGAALAPAVDRLADGLADDEAHRRTVGAEVAGPQATAALLAVLPVAGVVLGAGLGADPLAVLLTTPLGGACLVAGVALDLLGLVWTRHLVARALRA